MTLKIRNFYLRDIRHQVGATPFGPLMPVIVWAIMVITPVVPAIFRLEETCSTIWEYLKKGLLSHRLTHLRCCIK